MNNVQHITNNARISELALTFPTLQKAEGIHPWDPQQLDRWACSAASSGGMHAARFLLALWRGDIGKRSDKPRRTPEKDSWHGDFRFNLDTFWRCGPFDVIQAMTTWDKQHRMAFIAWAEEPWWP